MSRYGLRDDIGTFDGQSAISGIASAQMPHGNGETR
jgi:hypothetical protein